MIVFCKFSPKFSCNLSVSIVQNISVLDKSGNLSPVLKLIMKTKKNAFQPINSILYRPTGVIVDREERYASRRNLNVS